MPQHSTLTTINMTTPNRHINAALIDMDGTIYDSMHNHTLAWHRMITELGFTAERERFYLYEGMTGRQTITLLFREFANREPSAEEIEHLYHLKTEYFNQLPKVGPMPGADRFLNRLKELGIKRVLVTGSGQKSLFDRLEVDFPGIFSRDMMITSADVENGKPHPEPYLRAMAKAGVSPNEAIVIENAPIGVSAGHAAGAFTVGLTTGPIPAETLKGAGADIVLPSMEALADITDKLFSNPTSLI